MKGVSLSVNLYLRRRKKAANINSSTCRLEHFLYPQSKKTQIYWRISSFLAKRDGKCSIVRRDEFDS
ncbi:MAG: hypothetical protein II802_00080, partial [Clostridia bacterium]|nr:hypothetical protein [Clostridia bacterium]